MSDSVAEIKQEFARVFGSATPSAPNVRTHVIRAPGRVNLIGEHTDYNDGFVFPMAIEPEVKVLCRARSDGKVRLASTAFPNQLIEFSVLEKIKRGEPSWSNYTRGVAAELIGAGIPIDGADMLLANTLPVGGGLSSSAAIEVSSALAFLTIQGLKMEGDRLALICQKAEHEYALVPCGIMDQTIVSQGKAGHAMLLDCRDLSKQFVAIDSRELRVVIVNTMVSHELAEGEYGKRRKQCEEAVAYFRKENPAIKALRDVTMKQIDAAAGKLDDLILRRARHVVSEIHRTTAAAGELSQRHYEVVGELMVQSHNSLRDDYEVSCPELDFLVTESMKVKGVYGARMTGGGFGGCIVALVQPRSVDPLTEHLKRTYKDQFNLDPAVYVTAAAAGASVLE